MKTQHTIRDAGVLFVRRKTEFVADALVHIVWEAQGDLKDCSLCLDSTQKEMLVVGHMHLTTERDLQDLAELISLAWQDHRTLAPQIVRSLSGH